MKKNFFKKLSVVLALAMTVSAVAPATNVASAAAAPAFKSKSATVKVGQTKSYGMSDVTAYSVKFVIGNKKIATVTKSGKTAKVKGVAEGKTTLRADLKAYKSKKELQVRMPVTVIPDKAVLSNITQTKTNVVVAKFSAALTEVKAADFSLIREDNVVFPIKEVSLDGSDKTKVTITTFSDMKDGKTYTVTYDEKSVDFVASDGTVTNLNVTPNTITAGKETEIKIQTLDVKGVILSEKAFGTQEANITFTIVPDKGYTTGTKLYLPAIGDTAKATVEYHTYKYDSEGNEIGVIKNELVITAVADASTISNFNFTITNGATPVWDATSFEANKKVMVDKSSKQYAFFKIKDSNGDEISDYSNYKVVSSDSSKLLIAESTLSGNSIGVEVQGVAAGTAYIVVKNASTDATVTTLQVTIVAKSKATTLNLSGTSFSVSTAPSITTTVTATMKDQYGDDMTTSSINVELLSYPSNATLFANGFANGSQGVGWTGNKVTLTPSAIVDNTKTTDFGAYTFKVSATDKDNNTVSRTFSYNIVKVTSSTSTFDLVLSDSSVDTTITSSTDARKVITARVAEFKNGVDVGNDAVITSFTLKKADGTTIASDNNAIKDSTVGGKTFDIVVLERTSGSGVYVYDKYLDAGNYVITVVSGGKTLAKSFTVTDTQGTGSYNIKTNTVSGTTLKDFFKNEEKAEFSYGGVKQSGKASFEVVDIDAAVLNNTSNAYVRTVKAKVEVPGSNNIVTVTYTINQTFTGTIDGKLASGEW